jgi:hypothetical protein
LRSITRLNSDDWLMLIVQAFYTIEIVALNIVDKSSTNLLPPGYLDQHPLTDADVHSRSTGSKWVLVVEQCQCASIWLVKGCFLIMLHRITQRAYERQHLLVELLIAYVVITFVVMELLYFLAWCRPFHNYWAVPTPNIQCSAAINHLIVNAVFNMSSDLAVLCIALPMFIRSHLPLQRKLMLCAIFSLGIFVIICAALNKFYSFTKPFGSEWENWYVREVSTAILVTNLPFTWGFLRRLFGDRTGHDQSNSPDILSAANTRPAIIGQSLSGHEHPESILSVLKSFSPQKAKSNTSSNSGDPMRYSMQNPPHEVVASGGL